MLGCGLEACLCCVVVFSVCMDVKSGINTHAMQPVFAVKWVQVPCVELCGSRVRKLGAWVQLRLFSVAYLVLLVG